jgi:hypothetical protein
VPSRNPPVSNAYKLDFPGFFGNGKSEDSLNNVFQRMAFGLLEVVTPVYWIEPSIEEELGPLSVPNHETARRQSILVLCNDEIYSVALEVTEGFDDAVGRYNGCVGDHVGFEFGGCEQVGVDGERAVHDERCSVEVPEEC